jgi:hypothetical protein
LIVFLLTAQPKSFNRNPINSASTFSALDYHAK